MNDENKNKDLGLFSDDEDKNKDDDLKDDLEIENKTAQEGFPKEFLSLEDDEGESETAEADIEPTEDDFSDNGRQEDFFEEDEREENIIIPKSKAILIKNLLEKIIDNAQKIKNIMPEIKEDFEGRISIGQLEDKIKNNENEEFEPEGKIIEGVFDGQNMIGPDGKQYSVPANYASKSKLVEGDILKLTITNNGTFLYKQIGPIDRSRVVATLEKDDEGNCFAVLDNKSWKILPASVSYYKGNYGDEIIILVPKVGESRWAAVENIISNRE